MNQCIKIKGWIDKCWTYCYCVLDVANDHVKSIGREVTWISQNDWNVDMISSTNNRVRHMGAPRAPSTNLTCFARCLVKRFPGFRLNATFDSTIQHAWTRLHGLTYLSGFLEVFGKVWTKLKWTAFRPWCKVTEHYCFALGTSSLVKLWLWCPKTPLILRPNPLKLDLIAISIRSYAQDPQPELREANKEWQNGTKRWQ